jgi:hypothetical protein
MTRQTPRPSNTKLRYAVPTCSPTVSHNRFDETSGHVHCIKLKKYKGGFAITVLYLHLSSELHFAPSLCDPPLGRSPFIPTPATMYIIFPFTTHGHGEWTHHEVEFRHEASMASSSIPSTPHHRQVMPHNPAEECKRAQCQFKIEIIIWHSFARFSERCRGNSRTR